MKRKRMGHILRSCNTIIALRPQEYKSKGAHKRGNSRKYLEILLHMLIYYNETSFLSIHIVIVIKISILTHYNNNYNQFNTRRYESIFKTLGKINNEII